MACNADFARKTAAQHLGPCDETVAERTGDVDVACIQRLPDSRSLNKGLIFEVGLVSPSTPRIVVWLIFREVL